MKSKYYVKRTLPGYAIYHEGKRETLFVPDKGSASILLKRFKGYESKHKHRGMQS